MAMLYTLSDGTQVKLPEGLSEEQAQNAILKALPDKASLAGRVYDIEGDFNIRDGVPDLGIRWGLALARGNPEEIKAELDNQVGEGNWGMTEEGSLYITPAGLRQRGIEPKDERNVFVDGTSNGFYDLVDIAPEIAAGTAAVAGEVGLIAATGGTGLLAQLAIGAAGAAAGDVTANLGLEGLQQLRGTNRESPVEIFERVGSEGAAVLGTTLALGLPLAGIGKLAGKVKQSANSYAGKTLDNLQPVTRQSAQDARAAALKDFEAAGLSGEAAENLVPYITLKHMLGDQNTVASRMITILEGTGARSMGDALPARAVNFLQKYDSIVKAKTLAKPNMSAKELADEIKGSLSKAEQKLVKDAVDEIDNFYTKHGAKIERAMAVDDLTGLIAGNLNRALKAGMEKFKSPSLYGTDLAPNPNLNIQGLATKNIPPQEVASLLNKMAEDLGESSAEAVVGRMKSLSDSRAVGRLEQSVKFDKFGQAVGKGKKVSNARDLYDVQQGLRRSMGGNLNRQEFREAAILSNGVTDSLSTRLGQGFSDELARVNKEYRKFIAPFSRPSLRYLTEFSAPGVEGFTKRLLTGNKQNITFAKIVDDLDAALRGTEAIGGRASGVATADELLGTVATQYVRSIKSSYGLDDMSKPFAELQENAKKALNDIKKFEKASQDEKFDKAYKKLFDNDAYEKYKAALNKLAKGDEAGLDELGEMLSFKQARSFVEDTATMAQNLAQADLRAAVQQLRRHKRIDPEGGKFYSEMLYGEIMSRAMSIGSASPAKQMALLRQWSDDVLAAYSKSPKEFKELLKDASSKELGDAGDSILQMAEVIRGAANVDPSAGSIAAGSIGVTLFHKIISGAFSGAVKPLTMMYGMKSFGPGGPAWKQVNARLVAGQAPEKIEMAMKPGVQKALRRAQKAANAAMSGRNGLLAASVSAYMNEQGDYNVIKPGVKPKFVRYNEQNPPPQQQQQQAPDLAMQQQELGANIMNMLQSASRLPPMGKIGQSGLKEGAAIARAR